MRATTEKCDVVKEKKSVAQATTKKCDVAKEKKSKGCCDVAQAKEKTKHFLWPRMQNERTFISGAAFFSRLTPWVNMTVESSDWSQP